MHDVICVNLYHSKSWLNPQKKVNSVPSPLLLPPHNHGNKLFLPAAVTRKIMLGENNVTSASLHKKCIWLNSRLLNLSIQRKKDLSFLFGTYYFAKERYSQRSGRLIPFMPSKVTWSFSATEIQQNSTLSTKNVFITFQVSFKSVNRSGNKQFTPSCGSSSPGILPCVKTFISQTYSLLQRYDFSSKRRKENIHKTESPEDNVISMFGEHVHFRSFTANRMAKSIYFIEKWSIRSLKQTKKATWPWELVPWIWH